MTAIGDVIKPGEDIPEDVIAVVDRDGDDWYLSPRADYPWGSSPGIGGWTAGGLDQWSPLTVTAVREPEQSCPQCSRTEDPQSLCTNAWHKQRLAEQNHAENITEGCCGMVAVHMADCPQFSWAGLRAAIHKYDREPPADASPLLDLVRQYGDVRFETGTLLDGGDRDAFMASRALAESLFARIAALVPQQPIRARSPLGLPWWMHGCGRVDTGVDGVTPGPGCNYCQTPGEWRPLLVAPDGAPAPASDVVARLEAEAERVTNELVKARDERDEARASLAELFHDLGETQKVCEQALRERDEARAEVERYQRLLKSQASNFAAATAAQPDPLVLRLPEVPPGTVALVGATSGKRFLRCGEGWAVDGGDVWWRFRDVMFAEGSVTVELAPPREPRVFDELPGAPEGVRRVLDAHGQTWRHLEQGYWSVAEPTSDADRRDLRCFSELREAFGPLTEVLDEPGGAR